MDIPDIPGHENVIKFAKWAAVADVANDARLGQGRDEDRPSSSRGSHRTRFVKIDG
jgi:hypothetical protein